MGQWQKLTIGVLFVVVLLSPRLARAAEYWVDHGAAAGGDGAKGAPFKSIGDAAAVLRTGDTIWIKSGTYHEVLNFYHLPGPYDASHRTTVRAAPGARVIIDGGTSNKEYIVQAATPYMTFRGLTVRNGSHEAFQFYGCEPGSCGPNEVPADYGEVIDCKTEKVGRGVVFYFSGHGTVRDSDIFGGVAGKGSDGTVIVDSRIHGSSVEGITLHDNSRNCKYLNNVIYDNRRPNIYIDSASNMTIDGNLIFMTSDPPPDNAGIQLADEKYPELKGPVTANVTITNNVIYNVFDGIYFWDSGEWNGQSGMKNVTIANNTIVNCKNRSLFWDKGAHTNNYIVNNIFAQAPGVGRYFVRAASTAGFTINHNLWWMPGVAKPFEWGGATLDHGGWASASGQGKGDVLVDPAFKGGWTLPAGNFALSAGSPAIDMGVSNVAMPTGIQTLDHDFALASRPAGSAPDLGAFEFGGTPAGADAGNPALDAGVPAEDSGGGASTGSGGSSSAKAGGAQESGCGCRVGAHGTTTAAFFALLAALGLAQRRRRRRR